MVPGKISVYNLDIKNHKEKIFLEWAGRSRTKELKLEKNTIYSMYADDAIMYVQYVTWNLQRKIVARHKKIIV